MSQAPDHPAHGVANDVAADVVSGVVVQAGLVHGGVHVHPATPAVGSSHPKPRLPWLVAGALLILLATVTVTLPVHDTIAGEPVPQPGTPTSPPATFTLSGTLTLKQASDDLRSGKPAIASTPRGCHGTGSYSDLSAGTAVIVKDPAGRQVAVGALEAGRLAEGGTNSCAMPFSVPDVPRDLPSYSVTISRRGTHVSTPDQARAGIALSIDG